MRKIPVFSNANFSKRTRKKIKLPIKKKELTIRALQSKDRPMIDIWLDDHEGRRFLVSSVTARIANFDSLMTADDCELAVITLPQGVPIGLLAFLNIDQVQKKAELRKMIGDPSFRGHGYGKKATDLWIQYGLNTLGLRKIYLNTLNTNIRNIKLNEELGFKVEGVLRNEVFFEGEYHDVMRMGLVL
ncbi:MAG: GNAT family protein [candidate division KSB1 bacterium]|nr:GNAT family protein [candidate division KSB1 bacterium]